ncbi:TonB-dependent receptor [Sphingomonas profundi]|uniref:TonB-dependent receptor n=1 Tax=Alterirhizorhabdus profundi TaxID=2681549 RepID=UPI0018D17127|nr:TonB-dependent receptor [Sphingomonas profundi]
MSSEAGATPGAAADEAESTGGLAEIIVTAERRSTSLQRTPISVVALSGEALQSAQIRTLTDMQSLVPNFRMGENDGYAQITIRGIGISGFVPTAEGAVAVNQNEIYVSRPIAQLGGLYDVSSLEVLRGPQGTLYGRNATAGSVNITTTRPTDDWSGYGRLAVGNYRSINAEGAISGPIAGDALTFRVAGFIDKHAGYGRNLVTDTKIGDKDAWGVRGTIVAKPIDALKITVIGEYYKESDRNAALHYFGSSGQTGLVGATGAPPAWQQLGGYTATDPQDIATPTDPFFRLRTTSVTGIVEYGEGPFRVKSITGYRDQDSLTSTPLGGGSAANAFFIAGEPAHQFSQEIQVNYDSDRLHVTAGGFYFREKDSSIPGASPFDSLLLDNAFGLPPRANRYIVDFVEIGGTIRTRAKAAFAQATYEIFDGFSVTGGIRFSNETKEAALINGFSLFQPYIGTPTRNDTPLPPVTLEPKVTFKSTTPKIGIQYQIDPRTLIYASYSKGFKSGGYDVTTVAPAFEPEDLKAYEAGLKTTILDNRLRFNLTGFYYDYSNLQVLQVQGPVVVTSNAGVARIYGLEAEINALVTDAFTIEASGSYLHARYRDYVGPDGARPLLPTVDFSGNRLNNAPSFQAHVAATYKYPLTTGSIVAKGDAELTTRYFFTPANINLVSQPKYAKLNAFLGYEANAGWKVTGFVRNITNIDTRTSGVINTPILGTAQGAVAPPRTFGVELAYKF